MQWTLAIFFCVIFECALVVWGVGFRLLIIPLFCFSIKKIWLEYLYFEYCLKVMFWGLFFFNKVGCKFVRIILKSTFFFLIHVKSWVCVYYLAPSETFLLAPQYLSSINSCISNLFFHKQTINKVLTSLQIFDVLITINCEKSF